MTRPHKNSRTLVMGGGLLVVLVGVMFVLMPFREEPVAPKMPAVGVVGSGQREIVDDDRRYDSSGRLAIGGDEQLSELGALTVRRREPRDGRRRPVPVTDEPEDLPDLPEEKTRRPPAM